jgi:hypothetical protein
MEKNKSKAGSYKKASFCTKIEGIGLDQTNAEIRLGISLADEKAKQELKRRRIEAPLTIEEKLFAGKL